jgi:hypothetical protein
MFHNLLQSVLQHSYSLCLRTTFITAAALALAVLFQLFFCNTVLCNHGQMNYKDTKPYMSAFL